MGTVYSVIGPPRSGTSLVSCLIHTLGVPMGETFVPLPDPSWAPDHFWADAEFARLHDLLLRNSSGQPSYGMPVKNPEHWTAYRALVNRRETTLTAWGIKDLWLPILWPRLLSIFTHTVIPIFTARDTIAADASWQARTGLKTTADAAAALQPFRQAVATIQTSYPLSLTVDFAALVASPAVGVDAIAAALGMPLAVTKAAAAAKILPVWQRF